MSNCQALAVVIFEDSYLHDTSSFSAVSETTPTSGSSDTSTSPGCNAFCVLKCDQSLLFHDSSMQPVETVTENADSCTGSQVNVSSHTCWMHDAGNQKQQSGPSGYPSNNVERRKHLAGNSRVSLGYIDRSCKTDEEFVYFGPFGFRDEL